MARAPLAAEPSVYLAKARQNLRVAEAALVAAHFDACASRAYYAAFQAAVAALWVEGIRPPREHGGTLSHQTVHAEWSGRLIYRRKCYPPELRTVLQLLYEWRLIADYGTQQVTRRDGQHACRLCDLLVDAVEARLSASSSEPQEGDYGDTRS